MVKIPLRTISDNGSRGYDRIYVYQLFIVPPATSVQPYYILTVETTLDCDGQTSNNKKQYLGYVDFVDIRLIIILLRQAI